MFQVRPVKRKKFLDVVRCINLRCEGLYLHENPKYSGLCPFCEKEKEFRDKYSKVLKNAATALRDKDKYQETLEYAQTLEFHL